MRSNEESLRSIERAYLHVWNRPDQTIAAFPSSKNLEFGFSNRGRTMGIMREWYFGVRKDAPTERHPSYPKGATAVFEHKPDNRVVAAGSEREVATLPIDTAAAPVVFGYLIFEDVFEKRHTTRFCMQLKLVENGYDFQAVGPPSWSRDT
jgi:hypothetical protein